MTCNQLPNVESIPFFAAIGAHSGAVASIGVGEVFDLGKIRWHGNADPPPKDLAGGFIVIRCWRAVGIKLNG